MAYKNKEIQKEYLVQRPCTICGIIKLKCEFNTYQHKCKSCESKNLFKCYHCKCIKNKSDFPKDSSKKTNVSSYCKKCKNKKRNKKLRINKYKRRVTPLIRLRWMFKDCLKRLNKCKTTSTFKTLGFTKEQYLSKFPIIPEGKDIDHCIPLSWFKENTPINISCNLHNLQLLDSSVNQNKKNIYYNNPSDYQYFKEAVKYIKKEYLHNFKNEVTLQGGWEGLV